MGRDLSIIYKMTHIPTGKFYIGSLKDSSRFSSYVTSSKYVSRMMKDKPEEWCREIVESFENTPFEEVVVKEQQLIHDNVKALGWNGVWNRFYHSGVAQCYSKETVEKRNRIIRSDELRKAAAEKTKLQMSSPEARAVIAKANSARVHSEETKRRLSESHKGIKHTEETKRKIALAHLGKKRKSID